MDKVLEKLTTYNIFTNLFPGVIYCFVATKFFNVPLIQDDLVVAAFLYYFCGMVISRVSSLVVEPIMKKSGLVTYSNYSDYVGASREDKFIEQMLEVSNSYRSVIALLLCLIGTGAWTTLETNWPTFDEHEDYVLLIALLILFGLAFRKQTQYMTNRVALHKKQVGANNES